MKKVSIIIPIYNEEAFLRDSVSALIEDLRRKNSFEYELLLCENGSTDRTPEISWELARAHPAIRVETLLHPSYGQALKVGIASARYEHMVLFNADFWDIDFLDAAVTLLDEVDCVIGSKCLQAGSDRRSAIRRFITGSFNFFLKIVFGFQGTDTHGIKAFRRSKIAPLVDDCVTDKEVFDTELILRAQDEKLSFREIPVSVSEKRPTRYSLLSRVPRTLKDMASLFYYLRLQPMWQRVVAKK